MNIWRIGSKWGNIDILPEFKTHKIAFCGKQNADLISNVQKGDLVAITSGQLIIGVGTVQDVILLVNISAQLAEDYDEAEYTIVFREVFFAEKDIFGVYDGRGKQFHKAGDDYAKLIQNIFDNLMKKSVMQNHINLLAQKYQIILQGAPGTGKTRKAEELAYKLVFDKVLSEDKENRNTELKELHQSEQFSLIQFHPAYGYEDFVRGIVADTNENGQISYNVKNKILCEIAEKAQKNLLDSQKTPENLKEEQITEILFQEFKSYMLDIIEKEESYKFEKSTVIVYGLDEEAFLFSGAKWQLRMKFKDILFLFNEKIKNRKEIKEVLDKVSGLAYHLSGYYLKIAQEFSSFFEQNKSKLLSEQPNNFERIILKKYVLIIDEINRANLPAVLGELIYALEYRDKPVNSLYELDGKKEFTLPSNLYIIGTMNTADRSVGHIDYAIRRRFAFVSVPADESVITNEKAKTLFTTIKGIFDTKLSSDFQREDIMVGHSYFLVEKEEDLEMRLEYEIKPLLREYVKDGILTCDIATINQL